jgi:hypothetical protein
VNILHKTKESLSKISAWNGFVLFLLRDLPSVFSPVYFQSKILCSLFISPMCASRFVYDVRPTFEFSTEFREDPITGSGVSMVLACVI